MNVLARRRTDREMPNSEDFRRRYTPEEMRRALLAVIADACGTERDEAAA